MARTPNQTSDYAIAAKVTEKGQLSVYIGDRRFPVTLHAEHWQAILAKASDLQSFMKAPANAKMLVSPVGGASAAKGATTL